MFSIELLYETHRYLTLTNPVCFNEITVNIVDKLYDHQRIFDVALSKFKEHHKHDTTVDVNPMFWYNRFVKQLRKARNINDVYGTDIVLKLPNGCCTSLQCPVKLFYELIANEFRS
jgi:capsid portal protein